MAIATSDPLSETREVVETTTEELRKLRMTLLEQAQGLYRNHIDAKGDELMSAIRNLNSVIEELSEFGTQKPAWGANRAMLLKEEL